MKLIRFAKYFRVRKALRRRKSVVEHVFVPLYFKLVPFSL